MKKAKNISGQAPGGKRMALAEALPLSTPFVVQLFPIYACNFKCEYCIFSVDKKKRHFISDKPVMDFDLFKKCVDEFVLFPDKIKVLRFVGIGEPLLHKNIADMVAYAVSKKVAHTLEILTNGLLLTPKMSDSLISAGLLRIVVSLQGTSKEKYREICGANIDFDKFVENLRYFHSHKSNVKMYVKIVDCALGGKDDERKFYEIFGSVCDNLAIEHIVPIHPEVNYKRLKIGGDMSLTQFGLPVSELKICPQPFFHMQINPDGKVVPCYSWDYPEIMGDCNNQSAYEIWNGKQFQNFRRRMLDGRNGVCNVCAECNISKYRLFPEDVLSDKDAEKLKKFYE